MAGNPDDWPLKIEAFGQPGDVIELDKLVGNVLIQRAEITEQGVVVTMTIKDMPVAKADQIAGQMSFALPQPVIIGDEWWRDGRD